MEATEVNARLDELEAQLNGLTEMVAQMHVDLYSELIERADATDPA